MEFRTAKKYECDSLLHLLEEWSLSSALRLFIFLLSHFSCVRLCATPYTAAHQSPHPWDSPGKNTGVGCYFLLQCMKAKSESEVAQSCLTLSDPMDCSLRGSSVHGIFQARVLEWGAIAFSGSYSRGYQNHSEGMPSCCKGFWWHPGEGLQSHQCTTHSPWEKKKRSSKLQRMGR